MASNEEILAGLADSDRLLFTGRALQGVAMGYIPVAISMVREIALQPGWVDVVVDTALPEPFRLEPNVTPRWLWW